MTFTITAVYADGTEWRWVSLSDNDAVSFGLSFWSALVDGGLRSVKIERDDAVLP